MSSLVKEIVERQLFVHLKESVGWKFASIVDYSALLSKEIVRDLSFLSEICNVIIIMINWWNTRYFFIIQKRFQYRSLCLRACSGIH